MQGTLESIDSLNSRQFMIAIKKLANSLNYGTDSSPFLGSGTEYVQSRPYIPGDPIKAMDWRVTARTGKHHIKEYETPKQMPCYLMIDTSASMMVKSTAWSKYALAVHIAGGLGLACLDRVSPVGLVGVGDEDIRFQPSLSRDRVMQWLHRLRHFDYHQNTNLTRRLTELSTSLKNRVLVIVLSDLHQPDSLTAIKRVGQAHDCAVIQLTDPSETGLRGTGFMRIREAETGRAAVTRGRRIGVDQESVNDTLKRGGIDHLQLLTNEQVSHRLRDFFSRRGILGRGAR